MEIHDGNDANDVQDTDRWGRAKYVAHSPGHICKFTTKVRAAIEDLRVYNKHQTITTNNRKAAKRISHA